jgi:phospholipase/carboxylesterase
VAVVGAISTVAMLERTRSIAGLPTTLVGDPTTARFVCVILHGFAMSPADLSPFAHSLGLPGLFVFPEAPLPAMLEPGRVQGRAWWHIDPVARARALALGPRDFAPQSPVDLPEARRTLLGLLRALDAEETGRGPSGGLPRFLTGFSQGGMLVADCFMREPLSLRAAGLGFFSASRIASAEWPALAPALAPARAPALAPHEAGVGLPVFLSHGQQDPDLAFSAGEALRDRLLAARVDLTFVPFAGGHEIPLLVWRRFRRFLTAQVPLPAAGPEAIIRAG